ncbi:MAG: hypothetical protein KC416_07860 [Myxococcales bacterium]|nr:hypothetical protein [Myxococcales bacterium]
MGKTFDLERLGGIQSVDRLVEEIHHAGRAAISLYEGGAANRMERKPDRSPVTEADRAVEDHLRAFVQREFPDAAFVGEETGEHPGDGGLRFLVDPIDGTRAFIRGIPTWAILVTLEENGEPVLGIGHFPADPCTLVGIVGHGTTIDGKPATLSSVDRLENAAISHGGLHQFSDSNLEGLLPLLARGTYTQRGFADFDGYRRLLLGQIDAVIDPGIRAWDVGPAAAMIREAGGRVTSLSGEDTIYGGAVIASNGLVHDELLELVRRVAP